MTEGGLTLVEMMIALVVLLLVSLAMMQTALVSIDANMTNALRDEAVGIAEMRMSDARNLTYTSSTDNLIDDGTDTNLTSTICPATFVTSFGTTGFRVQRNLRNISNFDFCTNRDVSTLGADSKQVTITVGWKWKGQDIPLHTISTIVRRQ